MKLKLGSKISNLIVVVYVIATLLARFYLEPQINNNYVISILIGLFSLLFIWALIKIKFINPTLFGLNNN